ncbi:LuxR C-terminal-related transcriptional regulator [Streptomyces sp. NPDC056352]|uniref:response regulator transcription factor n=1 Tax=Streptomyces sp. NPDC056352 TaxID=3345791 RepID=UPI0035D5651D
MKIIVAEDSVLFREGLVRLLQDAGHTVVAAVGDAEALVAAAEQDADLAVVDVRMPPRGDDDGALAAVQLRATRPELGILLLSQHLELRHCLELIGTPGFGYLLKDRVLRLDEFDEALSRVATGGIALDPEVVQGLVRSHRAPAALAALTPREHDVLALVAEGHSNTTVAAQLVLSERTIEAHMRNIFTKLGLHDDGATHRRVLAVVTYLESAGAD